MRSKEPQQQQGEWSRDAEQQDCQGAVNQGWGESGAEVRPGLGGGAQSQRYTARGGRTPVNPLPWLGAHSLPGFRVPYQPLSPTDQTVDPLAGLELGLGCRHGCRSDKAGLGTAEQTDVA